MLLQTKYQTFYLLLSCTLCWRLEKTCAQQPAAQQYLENLQKKEQQHPRTQEELRTAKELFMEGVLGILLDRPKQAYTHLQQALQIEPFNAAIHCKLAHLLQQYPQLIEGQAVVQALRHIHIAIALAPSNPFYYTTAVMMHIGQGEYRQATQVYEQMFQQIVPTDETLMHLAGLYIAQEDYRQAIRVYNQIEQRCGVTPMTTKQKQSAYLYMNNLDGAVEEGIKLIKAYPGVEAYVMQLTQLLNNNDQGQRAIPCLQEDLVLFPNHAQTRLYLAHLLLEKGDYQQAFAHIKLVLPEKSLSLCIKLDLVTTYLKHLPTTANITDHATLAQLLYQTYPSCAEACIACGDIYLAIKAIEQALFYYHQALTLDQTNYAWWQKLIELYVCQKNTLQVQDWVQKALQRFPDQAVLHYYHGVACWQQRQYQQAIASLEKGNSLAIESPIKQLFCRYLGDAYHELQQYVQAEKYYEEALRLNPDDCHVLNNYSYSLALRKEKLSLAQEMAANLIKRYPGNANYLDTYAWVLYQLGHYKKAGKYLRKALELSELEVNKEILKHYNAVLEKLGQHKEAATQ